MNRAGLEDAYTWSHGYGNVTGNWDGLNLARPEYVSVNTDASPVTLDGSADVAYNNTSVLSIPQGSVQLAWDNDYAYILAEIDDEDKSDHDSFILWLDLDCASTLTANGNNARFEINREGVLTASGGALASAAVTSSVTKTEYGYNVELKIALSSLNLSSRTYMLVTAAVCDDGLIKYPTHSAESADTASRGYFRVDISPALYDITYTGDGFNMKLDKVPSGIALKLPTVNTENSVWISDSGVYTLDDTHLVSRGNDEFTLYDTNLEMLAPVMKASSPSGIAYTASAPTAICSMLDNASYGIIVLPTASLKLLSNFSHAALDAYVSIHLNQIGYRTDSVKRVIATDGGDFFWIKNTSGAVVYAGSVELGRYEERAGDTVNYCDFTDFTTPGTYTLYVNSIDDSHASYTFSIGDDVYDDVTELLVKCYYYNRCGDVIVDASYGRPACHAESSGGSNKVGILEWDGEFTYVDGRKTGATRATGEYLYRDDVLGGWHDAGDYGRYMTWEAPSAAKLLIAYRLNPDLYGDNTGTTESGNGVPDILDEVRTTLEWMFKLQRNDGAVYHKLTGLQHSGFVDPASDSNPLYLFPPSVEASADFAGAMAMAYRVYLPIDAAFANKCLAAAKTAYVWAMDNTALGTYPAKDGSGTGIGNSLNISIDLSFAAVSLYMATGDQSYHDVFRENITKTNLPTNAAYMSAVYDYCLNSEEREIDTGVLATLAYNYAGFTAKQITNYNGAAYEFAYLVSSYANQTLVSNNAALILSDMLNGTDTRYIIEENLNYILGKNAVGYCGVLGVGSKQIENAHLRVQTPGWITGGACPYATLLSRFSQHMVNEDGSLKDTRITPDMPEMKCYVDEKNYFYINEPTISSNSSAVITFAYMCD